MMNGLQSLTQWNSYFNNPTRGKLGLLNAIQVSVILRLSPSSNLSGRRILDALLHIPLFHIWWMVWDVALPLC